MKKNIKKVLYIIFLFTLFLVPNLIVKAEVGGDIGGSGGGYKDNECTDCTWLHNGPSKSLGVRLSLYQYSAGGREKLVFKSSIDVLNKISYADKTNVYSASNHSRYGYFNTSSVKLKSGTSGINFKARTEYSFTEFASKSNWAGTFEKELKKYLGDNKQSVMTKIKKMFGNNINITSENYDTFYIVVEPTYYFYYSPNNMYYYGTGYEMMSVLEHEKIPQPNKFYASFANGVIKNYLYNGMYVEKNNDSKLIQEKRGFTDGRYDKYNFVNHSNKGNELAYATGGATQTYADIKSNYKSQDYPYNLGIFWLNSVIKTCPSECFGKDINQLETCAKTWCSENDPNSTSCIDSCIIESYDSPGCEDIRSYNQCYDSINRSNTVTVGGVCPINENTNTSGGSTKICYDDITNNYKIEDYVVGKNEKGQFLMNQVDVKNSYYKIECIETFNVGEYFTKENKVLVNENGTASLYLGYRMEYDKTCQIYYKTSKNGWTTSYNSSKAANDIIQYNNWINELTTLISKESDQDEKNRLKTIKTTVETMKSEAQKVKSEAEGKLNLYKDKNYQNGTNSTSKAELEILNEEGMVSQTVSLTMETVSCLEKENENTSKYCDLTNNTEYIINQSSNTIYCETSTGKQTAIISNDGTKSNFHQIIYYALPDSYKSTIYVDMGEKIGNVFHDKQECLNAVDSQNGQCITVENAWVFNPFDKSVTTNLSNNNYFGNYQIKLKSWGSCAQFNFDLSCSYKLESSNICTENCKLEHNDITSEEYLQCIEKNCGCDSYCGTNVACRNEYCPQACDGCGNETIEKKDCGDDENDCVTTCEKETNNNEEYIVCKYNNCCRSKCNGNVSCIYDCCSMECNEKYSGNEEQINACIKDMCECENGACEDEYVYRTINIERPFPGTDGDATRKPGANWYKKVEYITNANDASGIYYDKTNGISNEYEYKFILNKNSINELRNYGSYVKYNNSKSAVSTISSSMYCSALIHDVDGAVIIDSGTIGSRCTK